MLGPVFALLNFACDRGQSSEANAWAARPRRADCVLFGFPLGKSVRPLLTVCLSDPIINDSSLISCEGRCSLLKRSGS